LSIFGMPVEWEEQPFEWVRPSRFGVKRSYSKGPIAEMTALAEFTPRPDGGTNFTYDLAVRPKSLLGLVAIPLQVGIIGSRRFRRAFQKYDDLALVEAPAAELQPAAALSGAASSRVASIRERLLADVDADDAAVEQLIDFIQQADD